MENVKVAMYMRLARANNIAFYCRVAHADADALAAQERHLLDYAEDNGYEDGKFNKHCVYRDNGGSGSTLDRPGMNMLMADIRDGRVDVLIVKDISRVLRNYIKLDGWFRFLKKHGVVFISVNDGIHGLA